MEVAQSLKYEQGLVLDTFTCFPKLPLELRLKIWVFAIRRRILTIESHRAILSSNPRERPKIKFRQYVVKARVTRQPALLHVNFESRQVALQHYKLVFKSVLSNGPVYFNDQLDVLHLKNNFSREFFWDAVLRCEDAKPCIRVLAIENVSSLALARTVNKYSSVKEIFWHKSRPWPTDMSLEARFRKNWDNLKGEDKRQLVVKFISEAALQEMIKVMETSCYFHKIYKNCAKNVEAP